jgi:tRNA threonylcarbamoyladenosine dehydratase
LQLKQKCRRNPNILEIRATTERYDDYSSRFGGLTPLYGGNALNIMKEMHVCVIGVGGVGSWAVEALARSGVGSITLIDMDEVCISNTNRLVIAGM